MVYLVASVLTLINAVWLVLVVLGLPGTWLMVGTTLLTAWWWGSRAGTHPLMGTAVLVGIAVLALVGEILEFAAGMVGTKKAGGTKRGATGALIGTIVGGLVGSFVIPLPVLGTLLGACGGAAVGAWALELHGGRAMRASVVSGVGAGVGRLAGSLAKIVVGAVIWLTVAVAAFWP